MKYVTFFDAIRADQVNKFGGKNASLGQMTHALSSRGIRVPFGFALSVDAYWRHLEVNNLVEKLKDLRAQLTNIYDIPQLQKIGKGIRALIVNAPLPDDVAQEVHDAYLDLSRRYNVDACDVAVRSSATAEDLPNASFAGQQESFLHINGIESVLETCKKCMASLFTDRAIVYRVEHGFDDFSVGLSVGVQKMVCAQTGAAGVLFSLDTETGFKDAAVITSSYGLGEMVVKGAVNPDEFVIYKPLLEQNYRPIVKKYLGEKAVKLIYNDQEDRTEKVATSEHERAQFSLSDEQILELVEYGIIIEDYYSELNNCWMPMDIEWVLSGDDNKLYIVQARPETVHGSSVEEKKHALVHYVFTQSSAQEREQKRLVSGQSVGDQIVSGPARIVRDIDDVKDFKEGDILVTHMTDPDWVPLMKIAGGIVTDMGGRTCHAAIVSRELGIPALIGTGDATAIIKSGQEVTLDCSQGSVGFVYDGIFAHEKKITPISSLRESVVPIMLNVGDPDQAFRVSSLPVSGVGLARLEFIIAHQIGVHPMAILEPGRVQDAEVLEKIAVRSRGYESGKEFYVSVLAQGIGMIAAAFYPKPVIVRLSDFKSNEYRNLLGGSYFEQCEENPMLGLRGASRYIAPSFAPAFELECQALIRARDIMGFDNIRVMVPFVRTVKEGRQACTVLERNGLIRGKDGLELYMMVEIPSNVIALQGYAQFFDGFSIGSNDLTQLVLGVDRDSAAVSYLFDERDPAVMYMLAQAIEKSNASGIPIGICGQAPSDFPELAKFLIDKGINSISLNADAVLPFLTKDN